MAHLVGGGEAVAEGADAVGGVDPVVGAGQAHVVVDEVLEVGLPLDRPTRLERPLAVTHDAVQLSLAVRNVP